ncbi:MAG: VIT1/CCC1 transporter family protein [Casimicrobiaceae bacterium]
MNLLESWQEEQRSAFLYRVCAEAEAGTTRAEMFARFAGEAEAQATIWRAQLTARGHPAPTLFKPDLRTRIVAALVRQLGPERLKNVLAAMKVRGMMVYGPPASRQAGYGLPVSATAVEHRHRRLGGGGTLRAAVFGVNDGLVSNAALVLGVAGATAEPRTVLLTGIAGLAAGAFAMAAGEYVSVQSQRELYEHQIGLEREELRQYPEAEAQELALIYAAKGLPSRQANRLARRRIADPKQALDALARAELGLNPGEPGSPSGAAIASFVSFAAGACLPLLPYVMRTGGDPLFEVVGLMSVALFAVGATLALFTGESAVRSGLRMLLIGLFAGGVTHAIGRIAGVTLS